MEVPGENVTNGVALLDTTDFRVDFQARYVSAPTVHVELRRDTGDDVNGEP